MKDGVRQTQEWIKQIKIPNKDFFDSQARSLYTYIEEGQQKVGGYFRQADNFTFIVTPQAGHMVAAT
jgi:carboxypeptidase C (cathepsin A)